MRSTASATASLDCSSWDIIDRAVSRLEEGWSRGGQPELGALLPPASDPLRELVLVELSKVDQERRFRSIREWPELAGKTECVAELISAECLTRSILREPVTDDAYANERNDVADPTVLIVPTKNGIGVAGGDGIAPVLPEIFIGQDKFVAIALFGVPFSGELGDDEWTVYAGDGAGIRRPQIGVLNAGTAPPFYAEFEPYPDFRFDPATQSFQSIPAQDRFRGSVRIASGDIDGDGIEELITVPGPSTSSTPPELKIFRLADILNPVEVIIDGNIMQAWFPFLTLPLPGNPIQGRREQPGYFIASGDVSGDERDDIILGLEPPPSSTADASFASLVLYYDASSLSNGPSFGKQVAFAPFGGLPNSGQAFGGGVRLAAADIDNDGFTDVVAGSGPGMLAEVRVFDGFQLRNSYLNTPNSQVVNAPLVNSFMIPEFVENSEGFVDLISSMDGISVAAIPRILARAGAPG